ncbi:Clavaminate synthase-like protein [Lentinus tigrinus ALCF2SS1-7]|uniref:Clavaminate synthase-like protein n=1 Tax=Lentinus tigrinus ALCF2SS1-6 TaxID=1328759 RepID=A0A5C2SA20_9APHY|nr:Clavaminate synthase-like protein [Lentinus tigrinus ALCF2SS1-6]RPD75812.1 Clavaminate synthase-like protein [Lentinus tigrinus ALCF2SS1-7]
MPGTTLPPVPHYVPASPTKEDLDWADLVIIDISKARTPEGRAQLAPQVRDAMRTTGFIYVVNHGMTQSQTDRIFDIGDVAFTQVSEEEKRQHAAKIAEDGSKIGYKLRQLWTIDNGIRDQHEQYALHRSIFGQQEHPKALQPYLPELRAFSEHNHFNVLYPILQMLALGMELPEDTFVNLHGYDAVGDTHARFIKYHPRTQEEELKTKNVWLKGHTDTGSVTILWSQPVSALQIMSPDGKWRWVRHLDNALVVNLGDTMEMLSGGYYKGTIHRVVQPPADHRDRERLGAYYFALTDDDAKLVPFAESPVLQPVGIVRKCADEDAPTMREWRRGRVMAYGLKETKKRDEVVEEQEIVKGIILKHYN